jgi:hypothetical protein
MHPVPQDDAGIAALRRQIAALEAAGNDAEAMPLAERYVETAKAQFGERHPSYAAALEVLAGLLRCAGRLDEAEALLRRALVIYQGAGGVHALELARTCRLLAEVLIDAGRTDEAEEFLRYASWPPSDPLLDGPSDEALAAPPPGDALGAGAPDSGRRDAPSVDPVETAKPAPRPPARPSQAPSPAAGYAGARREPPSPAAAPEPQAPDRGPPAARRRAEPEAPSAAFERRDLPRPREKVDARRALEIDAGRLAHRIPRRMWVNVPETVEVRLGRTQARGLTQGIGGRGEVRTEDIPIVETMSVSLVCGPGAFDIEARSEKDQLVKPDLVLGTAFHSDDFGRWVWIVTPRQRGEHTLFVKVSAAIRDSRGLPSTSSLPDRTFAVIVRVQLLRAAASALVRVAPKLAWVVVTTLVGIFTKDYWWPAIRHMLGWE